MQTFFLVLAAIGMVCSLTAAWLLAEKKNPAGWVVFLISDVLLGIPMFATMMHWVNATLIPTPVYVLQNLAYMYLNVRGIIKNKVDPHILPSEIE